MLHIQTEAAVAYKPTLARPLARNPHYGVREGRCGGCEPSIVRSWANDELSLGSSLYTPIYTTAVCCCEAVLLSRHDSLDSPSTLGIWVRSRRLLSSKELRAQRRHVLMDDVGVARC